jgi:hypothetical protein
MDEYKHPLEGLKNPFEGFVPLDEELENAMLKEISSKLLFQDPEKVQAVMHVLQFMQKSGLKEVTSKGVYADGIPLNEDDLLTFRELYRISLKHISDKGGLGYLVEKGFDF